MSGFWQRLLLGNCLLLTLALPATAEAPLGDWICTGQNAGDPRTYSGTVSIARSDQTYTVLWRFGAKTFLGTGIEIGDSFAVTFTQPQNQQFVGLVLLRKKGEQWLGNWTTLGGKQIGTENWRKLTSPLPDNTP